MINKARGQNLKFQIFCGGVMATFWGLSYIYGPTTILMSGFLFALGCFLGSKITIDIFRDSRRET